MKAIALIFFCLIVLSLCAETNYWDGSFTSSTWDFYANWSLNHVPTADEDVVIPAGLTRYPNVLSNTNAICNSVFVEGGASLGIQGTLTVAINFGLEGQLDMEGELGALTVLNSMLFFYGSVVNYPDGLTTYPTLTVSGNLVFYAGSNTTFAHGSVVLNGGTQTMTNYSPVVFNNLTVACSYFINSESSSYPMTVNGSFTVNAGRRFYNYANENTIFKGPFTVGTGGDVVYYSGTAVFSGSTNTSMSFGTLGYFNNLEISKNASKYVTLNSDIRIKYHLNIVSGSLHAGTRNINIGGNWTDTSPDPGFDGGASVVFDGIFGQQIFTSETFNNLVIDKSGVVQIESGANVTCASYQWLNGSLTVLGSFTANSIPGNNLYGTYNVSGSANLNLAATSQVNQYGTVNLTGGTVNIQGGTQYNLRSGGTLSVSAGTLNLETISFMVMSGSTLSMTGGTVKTTKNIIVSNSSCLLTGGTFELYGNNNDSTLSQLTGSAIYNLVVNKGQSYSARLISDAYLNGSLTINPACNLINDGYDMNVGGVIGVYGNLLVNNSIVLRLSDSGLTVYANGFLHIAGTTTRNALVSRRQTTGGYPFNVLSGGAISAVRTTFEYMNADGISIQNGATVNPFNSFSFCQFKNAGVAGGKLLSVNNAQDLYLCGVVFPVNAGNAANNVSKTLNQGSLNFICASGDYSGDAYENDPYGRIHWIQTLPPVEDINLTYIQSLNSVRLEWTYPHNVTRFDVYHSDDPYTGYELELSVSGGETLHQCHFPVQPRKFYYIKAVLE